MRHTPRHAPVATRLPVAWPSSRATAVHPPGLGPTRLRRHDELYSRATAYYTQLQALPRRARRALQRQLGLPLATLALWLALGLLPVQAATIAVGGSCTLVDALTAANTDTATGGCAAGDGADMIVLRAGSTQTLTSVNNNTYDATGLPVISSVITIAGQGSTIVRAREAPEFRLLAVSSTGALTLQETTVSGGVAPVISFYYRSGGGVANYGTLTIRQSTISGNAAPVRCDYDCFGGNGGGVDNDGTLSVTHSTIAGNTTSGGSGGGVSNDGTLSVTHSTIVGNSADFGGGMINGYGGTLTLARTLISGNTASTGPEIHSRYGTVVADQHNLFGVDGNAGVEGFSPGPTDVVPPAGVQLQDILNPTLVLHGGQTQTHALIPGSPAIDAGGPACPDAAGDPLLTDQRGRPRPVDGDEDGVAACDIGAFEFFPVVNDFVTLDPTLETTSDPTPVPGGPTGTFTITATFTHTSDTPLRVPFFEVTALSGGNLLLNADEGPGEVGATVTPDVGDRVLSPGEPVTVDFVIGLQTPAPFTFCGRAVWGTRALMPQNIGLAAHHWPEVVEMA